MHRIRIAVKYSHAQRVFRCYKIVDMYTYYT